MLNRVIKYVSITQQFNYLENNYIFVILYLFL